MTSRAVTGTDTLYGIKVAPEIVKYSEISVQKEERRIT